MILSFHPCFTADAQIIPGARKLDSTDRSLIRGAEAVILPQTCSPALYRVCKASSAFLFPNYDCRFRYPGKTGQSRLFEKMGWPHPETWRRRSPGVVLGKSIPEMPFFIKADESHEGSGVWLIRNREDLEAALIRLQGWGRLRFLVQKVIPCQGNVLRVVVLGRTFFCYWKRPRAPGRMVTTVSRGAKIDKRWRADLREKGVVQAKRVCRESGIDLAAMDFVFSMGDPDPQPLILEINYSFGRRGLGGSLPYYRMLYKAIRERLQERGIDPKRVKLV
jgi:ribosomal protein S6--L-glutamate ligase